MKSRVISSARSLWGSAWVRAILALAIFACSLGGLAVTSYADQYVNGGVAWGNNLPVVDNTVDNPLGVNLFLEKEVDEAKLEKTVQMTHDAGIKWVRQVFAWNDIEISAKGDFTDRREPGPPVDAWAKYDRIVNILTKYNLQIIARLDSPPVWARFPNDDVEKYRKGPPRDNNDYADFAKAVAARYKGKVKYFQIWNEPNLEGEWGGHPINPAEYTALLKAAYQAIKSVNPDAVIITAALAPTADQSLRNLNDVLFLEGMYQAGAAPYFDILSTMLYGLGQPPDERRTDLSRLNFSRPILLRHVMEKYNDTRKPIWISEYGWVSLPADFQGDPSKNIWGKSVDEQTQARWIVEGYERIRKEWPWIGAVCIWFMRQPDPVPGEPANYFSILNQDFTPRPAYNAVKEYSKQFPMAGTGSYQVDSPALATSVQYKDTGITIGSTTPADVLTETISFEGNRLDASLCADCALSVLSMDSSPPKTLDDRDKSILAGFPRTAGTPTTTTLAQGLKYQPHTAQVIAYIGASAASDADAITYTVSQDKPLANALGFPLLYALFGVLGAASAGYAMSGLGRWARAALDVPRGRYAEETRERARNAAAVAGFVLLTALYYKTESLPLILVCLLGIGLLAFVKPSVGLAAVTVTIPFFWYPKDVRGQHFPLAETLLFIVFGALMVRRIVAVLLPGVARWVNITPVQAGPVMLPVPAGISIPRRNGKARAPQIPQKSTTSNISAARRAPVLTEKELDELLPARWPRKPVTAPLGTTRIQVARVAPPTSHLTSKLDTAPLPMERDGNKQVHTTAKLPPLPGLGIAIQQVTPETVLKYVREWDRQDRFALPAVALLLAGSLAMLTLANPAFARDSARAFRWVIVEPVLFYFLLTDVIRTRRALWRIADFFVITAVAISLLGIWQYVAGTDTLAVEGVSRVFGVYQHPNNLALYLGRVLPLTLCAGIFMPRDTRKWLYLLASVPLGITTLLTFSRGAYLGVTGAVLITVLVGSRLLPRAKAKEGVRRDRWVLWASLGALVAGMLLIATPTLLPKIPERIFAMGSGTLRVDLWASSLHMLADHPIFGVGPDQFLNQFQSRYMTAAQQGESYTAHPHNMLLDYWLTLGIMGVPILLWLLWRYFREAAGKARSLASSYAGKAGFAGRALALGLLASMIDFAIHGMVDNSYFLMDLAMIFWLTCGLVQILGREEH